MSRRRLRVVHTSDVHLSTGANGREATLSAEEAAFSKVVDLVSEVAADALLIAGDLFDTNAVGEREVAFVESRLGRLRCPVVLIPGNHDCYDDRSVYRRFDFRSLGANVHPLTAEEGEIVAFEELGLTVWGKGMVDHHPGYRPLAGVPSRLDEHWFVGLAHGLVNEGGDDLRSSLIAEDEISESGLDYLALGHVHVFRDVSRGATRAFYAGAPTLSYAPERGSVAVVSFDPEDGVRVDERSVAAIPDSRDP